MNRITGFVFGVLGAVVVLIGIGWGIWYGVGLLPVAFVRVWAILTTVALPFAAWAAWWSGRTEARGRLAGFDKAIDRTFASLSKASGLSVNHSRATRQVQQPPVVVLPDIEIIQRRLSAGDDVVEL